MTGFPAARADAVSPPATENASGKLRSEEHTSELQSLAYLVCRLLLEKKKNRPRQWAALRAVSQSRHRVVIPASRDRHAACREQRRDMTKSAVHALTQPASSRSDAPPH